MLNKALIFIVLATSVSAWWGKGHLLAARIAYDILEKESPDTLSKVESMLTPLQLCYEEITKKEGNYAFVECATFADDIKAEGGEY